MRALRIVKQLEAEKRRAMPDEQRALGRYSGFGDSAFEQAFSPYGARDPAWSRRHDELEGLVSEEQYEGIKRSRLNAFYTSPEIASAMWQGLTDMGAAKLERPRVLEPSAGSGRFLGLQPPEMAARSERTAVELDPMTAGILRHLYPQTRVYNAGFQDAPIPDNHFDVAISNVPFGNIRVYDPEFNATGRKHLTGSVHNYFFAKTLDKLRPRWGHGLHHQAITRWTPQRQGRCASTCGAGRPDRGGAPSGGRISDTEVVTDIIYLKKRVPGEKPGDASWVETEEVAAPTKYGHRLSVPVNRYFVDNPDKVLGEHSSEGTMYRGDSYTVKSAGKFGAAALGRETGEIARKAVIPLSRDVPVQPGPVRTGMGKPKGPPKYVIEDGELRVRGAHETSGHDLSPADAARVRALVGIRDTARRLVTQEAGGADNDDAVEHTRESLRERYDAYVDTYGEAVNTPANRKLMARDADSSLLFALEPTTRTRSAGSPPISCTSG